MEGKNLEAQMRETSDREAIRNLSLQYCHCVWQQDLEGYVNLFTVDGSFSPDALSLPDAGTRWPAHHDQGRPGDAAPALHP